MNRKAASLILALSLSACGGGGGSASSAPPAPPGAPTGVTASYSAPAVTLTWGVQAGVQYDVYYSSDKAMQTNGYALYENAGMVPNASPPLILNGLSTAKAYYFIVTAKASGLESAPSVKAWTVTRYAYAGANSELVVDHVTGLTWERCLMGQSWDNASKQCTGTATEFNGTEASAMFSPDANGWRIPSELEIASLAFCNAASPPFFRPLDGDNTSACPAANEKRKVFLGAFPNGSTSKSLYTTKLDSSSGTTLFCSLNLGDVIAGVCAGPASSLGMYALRVKTT